PLRTADGPLPTWPGSGRRRSGLRSASQVRAWRVLAEVRWGVGASTIVPAPRRTTSTIGGEGARWPGSARRVVVGVVAGLGGFEPDDEHGARRVADDVLADRTEQHALEP